MDNIKNDRNLPVGYLALTYSPKGNSTQIEWEIVPGLEIDFKEQKWSYRNPDDFSDEDDKEESREIIWHKIGESDPKMSCKVRGVIAVFRVPKIVWKKGRKLIAIMVAVSSKITASCNTVHFND